MPKPRKLRLASTRITSGTRVVNRMVMGAMTLGRICRMSMRLVGHQ